MTEEEKKRQRRILGILGFFILVSLVTYGYHEYYVYLSAYLWFGVVYGMSLQYGRFCFASAFRDLFAVKVTRMAVGIMVSMVFFGLVVAFVNLLGMSPFEPAPVGYYQIIAGFIFGIGMVLAGGCASGSLYKAAEGSGASMLVLLSISVAQSVFVDIGGVTNYLVPRSWTDSAAAKGLPPQIAVTDGWMDQYLAGHVWNFPTLTFASLMGLSDKSIAGAFLANWLLGVVVPASILLLVGYIVVVRKPFQARRARERGQKSPGPMAELAGYWSMVVASKRTIVGGVVLGVAAGVHMIVLRGLQVKFGVENFGELMTRMGITFGLSIRGTVFDPGYWYITTQEAQWVGWIFQKLGWENLDNIFYGFNNGIPNPLINPADWMTVGLLGGAAITALYYSEFRWKKPTVELAVWAILGGTLMGIGSRLGLGCNVGAFFIRISNGNPAGWLFGIGMIAGAFIGVRFFNWWTERQLAREMAPLEG